MTPHGLLKRARKACASGDFSKTERNRRAHAVLSFCLYAHMTKMVHHASAVEFRSCVEWATPPPYLDTACARFHAGLASVAQSPGGLARLLVHMSQTEL